MAQTPSVPTPGPGPLHDPTEPPAHDPPTEPLHDPPGDPTYEPPRPRTDPTPNPASDPPRELPRGVTWCISFAMRQRRAASTCPGNNIPAAKMRPVGGF
jgi:hypothetical protein